MSDLRTMNRAAYQEQQRILEPINRQAEQMTREQAARDAQQELERQGRAILAAERALGIAGEWLQVKSQ